MNIIDMLMENVKDIWAAYHEHPFVTGIKYGTLEREKFRWYMVQDYLYLRDYAKVFAIGVAKSRNAEIAELFAKYIQVMNGEMDVHKGYLAKLSVTQQEVEAANAALDNI